MCEIQSSEQAGMVQFQHRQSLITIPRQVFISCAGAQMRIKEIEHNTSVMIEDSISGSISCVEAITAQIDPKSKTEFEFMARMIIAKALDEPQHCKACVSLSGALHVVLPTLPSPQGAKGETFMHALLDVFQTEFEEMFADSSTNNLHEESNDASCGGHWASPKNQHRIRAIVHFAGHLYCQRLLGKGVVSQMVQDLVGNGESEAANELLWFIGVVNTPIAEQRNLGTVLEDVGESDDASSEAISISAPERQPSLP